MKRYLLFLSLVLSQAHNVNAQKQGQALIDSFLQELPKAKEDTLKVLLFMKLSFRYSSYIPDSGIKYGMSGLDLAEKLNWKPGEANAYNVLAVNFQVKGNLVTGMEYLKKAYCINLELNNKLKMAQNIGNMANLYFLQGDYPKSLELLFNALKIFESINDKQGISAQLGNIANVYHVNLNFKKALEYEQKAIKYKREINDKPGEAMMLGNMGNEYEGLNIHDTALMKETEAMRMYEELGDKSGIARNLENIGEVYLNEHSYYRSLEFKFKALGVYEAMGDRWGMARCMGNIGQDYLAIASDTSSDNSGPGTVSGLNTESGASDIAIRESRGISLKKALVYLDSSVKISGEIEALDNLQQALTALSQAQELAGDVKKALITHRQYVLIKDSVYSIENNIKIKNLETKRELELKDKQLEINRLEIAKKRNERGGYIAGIILMAGIVVIVFRNYRRQKSTNGLLLAEKKKVEERTEALNVTNSELNTTLTNLKEAQQQLIITEKQKENEMIRSRIAMDIHDDVSSELTRISWVSELAKLKLKKSELDELPPMLDKITAASRQTIGKLGEIIWTVNPENDNMENMVTYMRSYIGRFFNDTSFNHTIDFPEKVQKIPVNPELKRNLFLVVKEALNNTVKYSMASQVTVSLAMINSREYQLVIADNGKGIDEKIVQGGGNGLKNMKNRMNEIRGNCSIESQPGQGTKIAFTGELY